VTESFLFYAQLE